MKILKIALVPLVILLTLEGLLRLFDPMGISYLYDERRMARFAAGDNLFYWYKPGEYHLKEFTLTILADHTRYMPDTSTSGDCTVVAIGDSVTQGWSVNDDEQWLNLIAREYPEVRFINAGMAGFNSRHVMIAQDEWLGQADFFIYYLNENDVFDTYSGTRPIPMFAYTAAYAGYFYNRLNPPNPDTFTHFWFDIEQIFSHENTLVVIDRSELANQIEARYPNRLYLIDAYTSRKSPVDPHPDERGMQQIASAVLPAIEPMIQRWCVS